MKTTLTAWSGNEDKLQAKGTRSRVGARADAIEARLIKRKELEAKGPEATKAEQEAAQECGSQESIARGSEKGVKSGRGRKQRQGGKSDLRKARAEREATSSE